jgi:hypothetical protein
LFCGSLSAKKNKPTYKKEYLIPSMYTMLGMLSEYISRFCYYTGKPYKNQIEFYYPSEKDLAEKFEKLLKQYQKEIKKKYRFKIKMYDSGRFYFYSRKISKIINSFYKVVPGGRLINDVDSYTLNEEIFKHADQKSRMNFIEGVYLRYGNQGFNEIKMYNAGIKLETIGKVLKSLNCKEVNLYYSFGIPAAYKILFDPTEDLKKLLKIEKYKTAEEIFTEEKYELIEEFDKK